MPMANPLASIGKRYRRLDPNEIAAVAQWAQQQEALLASQGQTVDQSGTQQSAPVGGTDATQGAAAAQQAATDQRTADQRAADTAQQQRAAQTQQASVAVPSTSIAPRTASDFWTKHIAQFRGKYLPDGPSMRPNCGPASVTMALRMVGLDIPGFSGQNSEAVLDKARVIATGENNVAKGTTDNQLESLISTSGGRWSESSNFGEMTSWVKQGIPVVMAGNPAHGWNNRYSSDQVYPFDGGHWVTVSGYDAKTGYYIVNDPLSQIGPIYVSEAELQNYNASRAESDGSRSGGLGIAVFR